jgi:hypothetical protein
VTIAPETTSALSSSWAEASAQADAIRAKTAAEAAELEIERKLKEAEAAPRIAAAQARAEKIAREAEEKHLAEEAAAKATAAAKERIEKAARRWKGFALTFALVCGVVSLPLQVMAFFSPHAWFLVAAPFVLEGGAWVLLQGAAAAIEEDRPTWHYRMVAGLIALFAAWINWSHGHEMFGTATGVAGAFCSLAGPAVWDLHEHGRIAKKQGKVTRAQRRREKAEAKRQAEAKAAREKAEADRRARAKQEEDERYQALAKDREESWADVWNRSCVLASALGETRISDQVWRRAWFDIYGTDVGDTSETIAARVTARARVMQSATTPAGGGEPTDDGSLVDGAEPLSAGTPRTATALVRKGKQRPEHAAKKAPERPLTEDELAKVRALADDLGDAKKLSVAKVREAVGGGHNEHLVRLRDAVQIERGVKQ